MAKIIDPKEPQEATDSERAPAAGGSIQLADLERIIDKLLQTRGQAPGDSRMIELAVKSMEGLREEVGRTVRRSNATHPGISAFSYPEGDEKRPKPKLKYETIFCGARQREDQLTPQEIDLFNQFTGNKDAREGAWTARIDKDGSKRRLVVLVPAKTIDHLATLPPLTQILSELLYGADVVDPLKQMDRIAALEAQLRTLTEKLSEKTVSA
jgi:hypothetical protein